MYGALKSVMFRMDPERAHHAALRLLAASQRRSALRSLVGPGRPDRRLHTRAFGLSFPAPLGMAAGFDKGAEVYNALLGLGFSHVEVGTVTPQPQPGNEGRRMQRLPDLEALVNRLGFPGPGAQVVAHRMTAVRCAGIVGANIGPNKTTAPADVPADLARCAALLAPHASYLAINVSSPNTPGLRALQTPEGASQLVRTVLDAAQDAGHSRPVLLKLHPDAPDGDLVRVGRAARDAGVAALIAANTTKSRPPGAEHALDGGLSGAPLFPRALAAIHAVHHGVGRDVPVVGVGGIRTGAHAFQALQAGATLLQAYTGFVYRGPRMPALVHRELVAELERHGMDRVADAVGTRPAMRSA